MNLLEAMQQTKCDVLRTKLEEFIQLIAHNVVQTIGCPVCGTDLRSSFQFQADQEKHPGQGICRVCHLGIQMHHHIEHADHIVDPVSKRLCQYDITLPVAMANDLLQKRLHDKWLSMKMPRRPLTHEEFMNWLSEASAIAKQFTVQ